MRKPLLMIMLAASAVLAVPASAVAGEYPPPDDSITANDSTVVLGQDVTFTCKTFMPGTPTTFTMFSDPIVLGTVNADAAGVAVLTAAVPNVAPGDHRVECSGTGSDDQPLTLVLGITVAGPGGGDLPRTGSDSSLPLAQLGLGAVAAGGLLVLVARRRRTVNA